MKNTGIVRRVDDLGRVVLPKELRRTMEIKEGDPLEIYVDEDMIMLHKYIGDKPKCPFCDERDDLIEIGDGFICTKHAQIIADTVRG